MKRLSLFSLNMVFGVIFTFASGINQDNPTENGAIDSLFSLSRSFVAIDNEIALLYAEKGKEQLKYVKYPEGYITYFLLKARIAYYNDNYELAMQLFDSIQAIINIEDASVELAQFYSQKALVNSCLGNYETGSMWNLKAIKVNQELKNDPEIALGYNFMGHIYLEQNDLEKAEEYFQKAYETIKKTSNELSLAKILGSLGLIEELKGNNQRSFDLYEEANHLFDKKGDLRGMATGLKRMAGIRLKQKDFDGAIASLKKAEKIYEKLEEKYGFVMIQNCLSMAYCKKGNGIFSVDYAKSALQIAKQINSKPLIAQSFLRLFEAHEKNGATKEALQAFKAYEKINTELISWQNNKRIASLEHEAQMLAKEKDIEILEQKNRIKTLQVYFLAPVAILLVFIGIGLVLILRMKNRNLKQKQVILEERNRIVEVEYELQKQMQENLENELELKNKELASKVLSILQMNETLQNVSSKVILLNSGKTLLEKNKIKAILSEIQFATHNNIWDEFDIAFNNVHNSFYDKLLQVSPNLSATEIKIAALLKLNLSTKEIAAISFKSESAIKTTRSRLRSKLDLLRDENLIAFLLKL